ncbi:MAG: acyclic terpene utilization AtuA family protein, partial [Streptosporangiaceae bacterium]
CPRVTDASLVSGPAAWWHGWARDDFDALAGAIVAGHVIECGPQATGGNYSFLDEIRDRRYPGFPIAEIAADGSSVITKHEGTGGLVSVGTVTAQLLFEIAEPAYLNPDVTTHFDTARLEQEATDRVAITGTKGSPPPQTLKVALNMLGGYRNTMTMVLTGLDIEQKAEHARSLLLDSLGGTDAFDEFDVRLLRFGRPDAPTNEQATAHLRITVKGQDERAAGRAFSDAVLEQALGGYAGFHLTTPPTGASAFGIYWPALVPASEVTQTVHLPDGTTQDIPHTASGSQTPSAPQTSPAPHTTLSPPATSPTLTTSASLATFTPPDSRAAVAAPLGQLCGARSGDKGGNANVGFWARDDRAYAWLRAELSTEQLRKLLPEASSLAIDRFELPNIRALNFVIHGLIAPGVAATTRPDAQAKGLGEYLRSRFVDVPAELLGLSSGQSS